MPLQVLPPGVTSLAARATPSFNAPLLAAPPTNNPSAYAALFSGAALSKDPRSIIDPNDVYTLRLWMKAVMGNSWRDDITLDDLMKLNPRILYKAACLYLQGRYWGALPDDVMTAGSGVPNTANISVNNQVIAQNWPNPDSPLEQRVFTWKYSVVPVQPPYSWLGEDVNGALWMPMIMPGMLIEKFDNKTQQWRTLNLGGTDRDFTLLAPGGAWDMKGWDFGDWWVSNADFAMVLKVIGFAVIAVAAAVTGGSALVAGAGLFAALGAAGSAIAAATPIVNAVSGYITAAVNQDFSGMLNGIASIVQTSFNINLKDLGTYAPALNTIQQISAPYLSALQLNTLWNSTGADLLKTINTVGQDAKQFVEQTKNFLTSLSVDTTKSITGMFPDAFMKTALTMGTNEIGQAADKIMADYEKRAKIAIDSITAQVPQYLNGWQVRAQAWVKQFGHAATTAKAAEIPWFGRPAFDAGTVVGAIQSNLARTQSIDLNSLTSEQKRALFLGDLAQICTADPNCIRASAEFLRQADLFWFQDPSPGAPTGTVQWWADYYKLRSK